MNASNATRASFLVSAIFSSNARLALACWLFGNFRTDTGHDLALGQMPMANQPLLAFFGQKAGMPVKETVISMRLGISCRGPHGAWGKKRPLSPSHRSLTHP